MKSSSSARGRVTRVLGIMVVASLLSGLLSSRATWAQVPAPTEPAPAPTLQLQLSPPLTTARPSPAQWEAWRASMSQAPMPKKGCFKATYPNTEWQEVPCTTAPLRPYPPARGRRPDTVGNGNDFAAQVSSGYISEAVGSFDSVAGVTSESGDVHGVPPEVANTFSLQLNTNTFTTSACSGAKNPSACQGWQQFVFSNSGVAFMQYWLIGYDTTCPTGWYTYVISSETDCYKNGINAAAVPVQTIADLGQLKLSGVADSGGMDTVQLEKQGSAIYSAQNEDSVANLAEGWQVAEFNIFGDCCSSEANFNSGSTIVVRTSVYNGTTNAPSCVDEGFTGETNSLTLVNPCCTIGGEYPAIAFKESSAAGATSLCGSGIGVIPTFFNGQVYDGNGLWQLTFPDGTFFGYYSYVYFPWLYQYGLGFEYSIDANNASHGVYFYDLRVQTYFYTDPNLYPYLYNFNEGAWWWYFAGTSNPRYFWDISKNQLVSN